MGRRRRGGSGRHEACPYGQSPFLGDHFFYIWAGKNIARIPMRADRHEVHPAAGVVVPLEADGLAMVDGRIVWGFHGALMMIFSAG